MRLTAAMAADIRFQLKQGFYTVYIAVTLIYMLVVSQLSNAIAGVAVPLIVFSDPTIVGFFFIGGIVMLEKVQGILQYIVVTPLRTKEYLFAKVISLSLLAEASGLAITAISYKGNINWPLLFIAILLNSAFFTLYGYIAAAKCNTMNQYFMKMVPYSLIIILPCFSLIDIKYSWLFDVFPSVAGLKLVFGAFHGIGVIEGAVCIAFMSILDVLMFFWVERIFNKFVVIGGGANE